MSNKRSRLGQKGEDLAADHICRQDYRILERNYRCKIGEIDIIALYEEYLIFVEVKTRAPGKMEVDPLLSMTAAKINRLRKLGEYYRVVNRLEALQPRFDFVGIVYRTETDFSLNHIENAF